MVEIEGIIMCYNAELRLNSPQPCLTFRIMQVMDRIAPLKRTHFYLLLGKLLIFLLSLNLCISICQYSRLSVLCRRRRGVLIIDLDCRSLANEERRGKQVESLHERLHSCRKRRVG